MQTDQNPVPQDGTLEFLWKANGSGASGCPALYRSRRDGKAGYVVQGKHLTAEERAQLRQLAGDEDGMWVPADVIEKIRGLM